MKRPIFLLSSERSGSNLVRVIFDSHRNICGPTTPAIFRIFMPLLPSYGRLEEDENFSRLARDIVSIVEHHVGEWASEPTADDLMNQAAERSFAALVGALFSQEAQANGKQRVFVKDNGNIPYVFALADQYPDAHFVLNVRDPRDVVSSALKTPGHPGGTTRHAAQQWREDQEQTLLAYSLLGERGRVSLIHYEDLVSDPINVLERVCSDIDEPFDDAMASFHTSRQAKMSSESAVAWENLSKPLMSGNFGKWRKSLSGKQIRVIEEIAGREMKMLGYPLENPTIGPAKERGSVMDTLTKVRTAFQLYFFRGKRGHVETQRRIARVRNLQRIRGTIRSESRQWSSADVLSASDTSGSGDASSP